jgi:hypothetical protein
MCSALSQSLIYLTDISLSNKKGFLSIMKRILFLNICCVFLASDFRSSLPIMVDLKNEALRESHWRQIIQETSIDVDLSNNVLTLENIFQMNLHQYNDIIQGN